MPSTEAKLNQNIRHYCRKIERHPNERAPLLRALEVLGSLRGISFAALSDTGAGKTVNGLKRHEDGEVAARARALVAKWKDVVQKEDEGEGQEPRPEAKKTEQPREEKEASEERVHEPRGKKPEKRGRSGRDEDEKDGQKRSRRKSADSLSLASSSKRHKSSKNDAMTSTSPTSSQHHKPSPSSSSKHKSSSKSKLTDHDAFGNALNGLADISAPPKESKRSSRKDGGGHGHRSSSSRKSSEVNSISSNKNNADEERSSPFLSSSSVPLDLCTEYKPLRQSLPIRTNGTPSLSATDDGALSDLLAMRRAKTQRSAVYSGAKRSGYFGSVPSLEEICIRTLQENVDSIAECGGLPYSLLKPILERASPPTLAEIEEYNPYLMEDTGELWERFVRKSFPKKEREETETWRDVHERCTVERELKLDMLKNRVKDSYKDIKQTQKQTKLAYVDVVAKPPRGVRRAQERNGIFAQVGVPHKKGSERSKAVAVREQIASNKKAKVAPMMAKTLKMMKGFKNGFRR